MVSKDVAQEIVDEMFEKYDQDNNGYLDKNEAKELFAQTMRDNQNDFEVEDQEQFQQFFEKADRNNDNRISYKEAVKFIRSLSKKDKKKTKEKQVKPFNAFDHGKGSIHGTAIDLESRNIQYQGKYSIQRMNTMVVADDDIRQPDVKRKILSMMVPDAIFSTFMLIYFGIRIFNVNADEMEELKKVSPELYFWAIINWVVYAQAVSVLTFLIGLIVFKAVNTFRCIFTYFYTLPQIIGMFCTWVFIYFVLVQGEVPENIEIVYRDLYIMMWFRLARTIFGACLLGYKILTSIKEFCSKSYSPAQKQKDDI